MSGLEGLPFDLLQTHNTAWQPTQAKVTLNARCDARIVPSPASVQGARVAYGHVVVLDDFFDEQQRVGLLELLTQPGWDHAQGPPTSKWERETADGAGLSRTWGLTHQALQQLRTGSSPAMREVQSRLALLYPECQIAHMPSDIIQGRIVQPQQYEESSQLLPLEASPALQQHTMLPSDDSHGSEVHDHNTRNSRSDASSQQHVKDSSDGLQASSAPACQPSQPHGEDAQAQQPAVDCDRFVANAAVYGDDYSWHLDADPADLPSGTPWSSHFQPYCNGEKGKPLFVSLLLYLNHAWPCDWNAETLFLDVSDVGLLVRPKRYRAVLMDQDVLHRLSPPSRQAGSFPRYSLVWKLVLLPRQPGQACCLARPEWGAPTDIGSAARLQHVKRTIAQQQAPKS